MEVEASFPARWKNLDRVLLRKSPFGNETGRLGIGEFSPGPELVKTLRGNVKVLVVGAGGLGCEILKDLALSGITNIHVIGECNIITASSKGRKSTQW
jgi:ubiquitin-activating enzyme E1 C